jgi:hypothetical protein
VIHVVTGHICAGKSRLVRERARPEDLVIDFDELALALAGPGTRHGDYTPQILEVARLVRRVAIDEAIRHHRRGSFDLWIIHAYPSEADVARYRRAGAGLLELTVDPSELRRRAAAERTGSAQAELERRLENPCFPREITTNLQTSNASENARNVKTAVFPGKTRFFHKRGVGVADKIPTSS